MSDKYLKILEKSKIVDEYFKSISTDKLKNFKLSFNVPENHLRHTEIKKYSYNVKKIDSGDLESATIITDPIFKSFLEKAISHAPIIYLDSSESDTKEIRFLENFIEKNRSKISSKLIILGGNLILNVGAYLAEKLAIDLVYIPTTVISMSDGSMGGKVRANKVENNSFAKHFYKSYYEPNEIIVDPYFLGMLSEKQIAIGLSEIVKHGVYQSKKLLEFLANEDFKPFEDRSSLLKAILWTATLKNVCLEVDPDESADGAYVILRGGHDWSDKLEERSGFTLSHGEAVSVGVWKDVKEKGLHKELAELIYKKFNLRRE